MGYSLYWKRPLEIEGKVFLEIVTDFKKTLPFLKRFKVKLAGGDGHGEPRLDMHGICFNGAIRCGHRHSMPDVWGTLAEYFNQSDPKKPLDDSLLELNRGRGRRKTRPMADNLDWERRRCPGSCAFETFFFPRVNWNPHYPTEGLWSSCKTNRRYYELAIQVCLMAAKYHLGNALSLEGDEGHWEDARRLCQKVLGYGREMRLFQPGERVA